MNPIQKAIEDFLHQARRPCLCEPGEQPIALTASNFQIADCGSGVLLQAWNEKYNLARRVVGVQRPLERGRLTLKIEKFGKKTGGDIIRNKKTFLLVKALESGHAQQKKEILQLLDYSGPDKVEEMLQLFRACAVDAAAQTAQQHYFDQAMVDLERIRIDSGRKIPLHEMAVYLMQRNT